MRKTIRKFLSMAIALAVLVGAIPTGAIAAGSTNTLTLGVEQTFAVSEEETPVSFTFTAPQAGTYILYFKKISQWPIGLGFPGNAVEYHYDDGSGDFQGHVMEMAAGESASLTFLYPEGELPEDYSGYTGTVGVGKKAETLTGFHALEEPDGEGVCSFAMQPRIDMNFLPEDPLCYGVTWEITVEDETILTLESESSEDRGASFRASFVPNQPGETNVTVSAAYEGTIVEKTYRIRVTEEGEGGSSMQWNEFTSFEELKELAASQAGEFYYVGTGPLEITEEITIDGYLHVPYSEGISGTEYVHFAQEWQRLVISAAADSMDSLAGYLAEIGNEEIVNEQVWYHISVQDTENADRILTQDITIPRNVIVSIDGTQAVTVAAGVTVTCEGELQIHAPVVLEGALVNEGFIMIFQHGTEVTGALTFSGGSYAYSGSGDLQIIADAGKTPADILSNANDFDVDEEIEDGGRVTWILKYAAGLIKLGTPTDLSWGTRYVETENGGYSTTPQPGVMSWKTVLPDQARAKLKIYDSTTGECVFSTEVGFDPQHEPEYRSLEDFLLHDLESGTYYFTAQSLGDYETYRSSDVAVSGTYTYVKPSAQLNPCTELYWNDRNDEQISWAHFTLPENEIETVGFEVVFYFSPEEEGEYEAIGGMSTAWPYGPPDNEVPLEDIFIQQKGVGYYKFRVRIVSPYIEEYCSSEWSEFSAALDVKTVPQNVNDILDGLMNDPNLPSASTTAIRNAVQSIDPIDLKAALLTDQENTEATAKLAYLENLAGGPAAVSVTSGAGAFDPNKVSVVGANLNNNASEDPENNPITLVLDKPAANHVIPERYDSAVAVSFSMTLDNVEDPENLQVPVKITLPVPDSINPDFLVILHYHADGEVELLEPYVYEVNGEYFADFVLTSFSDFIMTEDLEPEGEHVHVFDQEVVDDCYLETPADCENPAVYHKSCECGEMGEETFEAGEPAGHCFDGEDGTVCTRCGFKLYAMISGADQIYYKGSVLGLTFRSEASLLKFRGVKVDGEPVDPWNYVVLPGVKPGRTAVLLKASYLNSLGSGDHVITIVAADGEAEAGFTVARKLSWPGRKEIR